MNSQGRFMRLAKNEKEKASISKLRLHATFKDKCGYKIPGQTLWTIKLGS